MDVSAMDTSGGDGWATALAPLEHSRASIPWSSAYAGHGVFGNERTMPLRRPHCRRSVRPAVPVSRYGAHKFDAASRSGRAGWSIRRQRQASPRRNGLQVGRKAAGDGKAGECPGACIEFDAANLGHRQARFATCQCAASKPIGRVSRRLKPCGHGAAKGNPADALPMQFAGIAQW